MKCINWCTHHPIYHRHRDCSSPTTAIAYPERHHRSYYRPIVAAGSHRQRLHDRWQRDGGHHRIQFEMIILSSSSCCIRLFFGMSSFGWCIASVHILLMKCSGNTMSLSGVARTADDALDLNRWCAGMGTNVHTWLIGRSNVNVIHDDTLRKRCGW